MARRDPRAAATPCRYWSSGRCSRGGGCAFLHTGTPRGRGADSRRHQKRPSEEYLRGLVGDGAWDCFSVAFAAWWFCGVREASDLDVLLDSGACFVGIFVDALLLLCSASSGESLAKEVVFSTLMKLFCFYGREACFTQTFPKPSDLPRAFGGPDTAAQSEDARWQRALKAVHDKCFAGATGSLRDLGMPNMLSGMWPKSHLHGQAAMQFHGRHVELNPVPWEGVLDRWLWAVALVQLRSGMVTLTDRLGMLERYKTLTNKAHELYGEETE